MTGSFLMPVMQYDPLGIGNRLGKLLQDFQPKMNVRQEDGYLFTPDGESCLVTIESPFGSSETNRNAQLLDLLEEVAAEVAPAAQVHFIGAPVIAVGNAKQIQHDTLIALSVSMVVILLLLLLAFKSLRSLWYIILATTFGSLLALAGLSVFCQQLSLIVIGIASIIIGIAVNYPLHFVCHSYAVARSHPQLSEEQRGRMVLSDLVQPLLIGNITTVAAFLTLVPLKAVAIRQLGLFSALLLIGTIVFVLVVMPHFSQVRKAALPNKEVYSTQTSKLIERIVTHRLTFLFLLVLTGVLGWFSLQTSFDSDVTHLNYMTEAQRSDMSQMAAMQGESEYPIVFVAASQESMEQIRPFIDSLQARHWVVDEKNPSCLLPSENLQQHRLELWKEFWRTHNYLSFLSAARNAGFSEEAFEPFQLLIEQEHPVLTYNDFYPLTSSVLTGYSSPQALVARLSVVDMDAVKEVETLLNQHLTDGRAFNLNLLNRSVANALTDDFNYIGFACAFIVFIFLWFSFGRIELALLAFAPMAIGWIWILGLMQLFDIQFNIVNIILATFIFGQGDDYTIFITEGLIQDYKQGTGRKMLVGYQRSILLSAAIMLVGIGSLILAKHPAMHSLAEVTIVGMTVVVFMAWLVPPMLFHWLVTIDKPLRNYLNKTKYEKEDL